MKASVKKKWVKALKSGEYKQGKNSLRPTRTTYCCLGVLCDLYLKEKGRRWGSSIRSKSLALPPSVMKWAGLEENDPLSSNRDPLSYLNDSGKDFSDIASTIKEDL